MLGFGATNARVEANQPALAVVALACLVGCNSSQSPPPQATEVRPHLSRLDVLAGQPGGRGWVDGLLVDAHFQEPWEIASDGANTVYVADSNVIRAIDRQAGTVTTLAGKYGVPGSSDGVGTQAAFSLPSGFAFANGILYLSDTENLTLRQIDIASGAVTTLAGVVGSRGFVDGPAAQALLGEPEGIALDGSGNLYFSDTDNNVIRVLNLMTRMVSTVAGGGPNVSALTDGVGTAAAFSKPKAMRIDTAGNLYVADAINSAVRKVVPSTGAVTTVATFASVPQGLAIDGKDLLVSLEGTGSGSIVRVTPNGTVTTVAGSAMATGFVDGMGGAARFNWPAGLYEDPSGKLFIVDSGNFAVREMTIATAAVVTYAGSLSLGSADGKGRQARFAAPQGIAGDDSTVYVADTGNDTIRAIDMATGTVTTLTGATGQAAHVDGPLKTARFDQPQGLAFDSAARMLYVGDMLNRVIRQIDLGKGTVSTLSYTNGPGFVGSRRALGARDRRHERLRGRRHRRGRPGDRSTERRDRAPRRAIRNAGHGRRRRRRCRVLHADRACGRRSRQPLCRRQPGLDGAQDRRRDGHGDDDRRDPPDARLPRRRRQEGPLRRAVRHCGQQPRRPLHLGYRQQRRAAHGPVVRDGDDRRRLATPDGRAARALACAAHRSFRCRTDAERLAPHRLRKLRPHRALTVSSTSRAQSLAEWGAIALAVLGLPAWVACGGAVVQPPSPDASTGPSMQDAAGVDGATGTATAPDCPGCTFPDAGAPACTAAPSIKIVYPPDQALLPPNLGTVSVQWVPYGAPFVRFEVDFTQSAQAPITDWHIITSCSAQTTDQLDARSGGCEIAVDPASWSQIAAANRGGAPVAISVRGTTDGACASTSEDTIHVSFAQKDVAGTYFYWRSQPNKLGLSGQVWGQSFGDLATSPGQDLTTPTFGQPICAGCHSLSRDGSRMVVCPVDDTDPDYGTLTGSYIDLTSWPAAVGAPLATGQPPGWTALASSAGAYLTSNGLPCLATSTNNCPLAQAATPLSSSLPANAFSLWNGQNGSFRGAVALGPTGTRPTMPDWSLDGTSVVFVVPTAVASWDSGLRSDDDHVFGGSLYTSLYAGSGKFGAPTVLVASHGENDYYPSFSPDAPASFVVFDRAPLDMTVSTLTGCSGTPPKAVCPNDSFANPAARLMLVPSSPGATAVDLANANGSPVNIASALSNSYPRFAPFVQSYKGKKLYWVTFSSTRDYALRVLNHKDGMYPCYPSDSYEWPGSVHANLPDVSCQHPQLWMAPILVDPSGTVTSDPSGVAFWIPYQDATSHNHLASWMWRPPSAAGTDGGSTSCGCAMSGAPCGPANGGCGCCAGSGLVCSGDGRCVQPIP